MVVLPLNAIEYGMGMYKGLDIWNYKFGSWLKLPSKTISK